VDAGCFSGLQFRLVALVKPLSRDGFVAESNSTNGTRRVAILAGLAARRIGAEQAPRGFFLEVHSFIHSVSVRLFSGDKNNGFLHLRCI
jgi:hypothetical protein